MRLRYWRSRMPRQTVYTVALTVCLGMRLRYWRDLAEPCSCPYNDVKHIFPLFILRNEKRQKWKFPFETSSWPLGNNHYDLLLPQHVTLIWPNTKWPLVSPRCSIRDPSPLPSSTYLTIVREVWWWGWQKNVVTVSLSLVLKHKNSTQLLPSHIWDLPKFAVEKV